MKTNVHFLSYFAQIFLKWEIFQTEIVHKIKTYVHCLFNNVFVYNSALFDIKWENILEPVRPRSMRITCWGLRLQTDTQNM